MRIVGVLILSLTVWSSHCPSWADEKSGQVEFVWEGRNADLLRSQKSYLEEQGGKINKFGPGPSAGVGPAGAAVIILAGSAAICVLAQSLTRALHSLNNANGGLEAEIENGKIKVYERSDVKSREIIIRSENGKTVEYKMESSQNLCTILTAALHAS